MGDVAAYVYGALTVVLVLFHLAMALGAPWGHLTMGGRFPGRLKGPVRLLPLLSAGLLLLFVFVVWHRAGLIAVSYAVAPSLIWIVLGLMVISSAGTDSLRRNRSGGYGFR